ncbi:hypothetical protein, partial [Bacteroides faecis]
VTPMVLRNSGRVGSRRFKESPPVFIDWRGFLCFGGLGNDFIAFFNASLEETGFKLRADKSQSFLFFCK